MKHGPDIGKPGFDLMVKATQSKLQVFKSVDDNYDDEDNDDDEGIWHLRRRC